ncbi:hypothetical protein V757_09920 [Pelistega indica]|uniref:Uncharacterized protein n=1 Tax=Pelistega indica TaxID=1414851 RepID=V8FZ33_9BURK|nr:hypothetical protein V757_09920 [Pelistega indica]
MIVGQWMIKKQETKQNQHLCYRDLILASEIDGKISNKMTVNLFLPSIIPSKK